MNFEHWTMFENPVCKETGAIRSRMHAGCSVYIICIHHLILIVLIF